MQIHPSAIEKIRRAVAEARAVDAEDEQLIEDHLEAETDFMEIVGGLIEEMKWHRESEHLNNRLALEYKAKAGEHADSVARIKKALGKIRNIVGQNIKHPLGSVIVAKLASIPQKASDFDVSSLPDDLVRRKEVVEADADKVKAAMEQGRNVPGYQWSGERESVRIK